MKPIKTIALLINPQQTAAELMAKTLLKDGLSEHGLRLTQLDWSFIDQRPSPSNRALTISGNPIDLVLVLGGDGTMIRACRLLAQSGIPLMGVNHGRLGFLTDVADGQLKQLLQDLACGHYTLESRHLLSAKFYTFESGKESHQKTQELLAVNDVYVNKMESHGVLEVGITVDGDFVQSLRADGLVVSTSTGSTAYALSAGGPIVHPEARGLVMLGVAPHSLTNRPIILPESSQIALQLPLGMAGWLFADGHYRVHINDQHRVLITRSRRTYILAHPKGYNFYHNLRDKLHWNEAPKRP